MKAFLLALAALSCHGAASAGSLFDSLCQNRMARTVITVNSQKNGYSVDNTIPFRQLPAKSQKPAPLNGALLGVTATNFAANIGFRTAVMRNPFSSYECASSTIEVKLSYEPTVIYIGREFVPGTCAYREILAHEMRHLNTYFDQLPKVEMVVRAAMQRRFDAKAVYGPQGMAQSALKREIESVWLPFVNTQIKQADRLHDAIDTPQEYDRLSRVCQGEVQSFIAPAAQMSR